MRKVILDEWYTIVIQSTSQTWHESLIDLLRLVLACLQRVVLGGWTATPQAVVISMWFGNRLLVLTTTAVFISNRSIPIICCQGTVYKIVFKKTQLFPVLSFLLRLTCPYMEPSSITHTS